ncbi:hypothetical protein A8W25_10390 [Streptomyces sp. ERV7]|uniref:hypothetical protein n=1 Tax=Streptomyces sp. ERV7 TaxID=1322334 RepID=UPI0007F40AD8|nr:hypothetical protein [Streptomyces sp. ERV7]OAR25916.1 hypothetical protein A8W25_10390 [Streptomyces sp. ERV7]
MPADQELIHGRIVVTQEVQYMTSEQMKISGIATRDVLRMGWHMIDPFQSDPPPCDIQGCTYVDPETESFHVGPAWATHRISTSRGLFRKRKAYFSCPDHLDTVKAALVFGHSGDPA